MLKMRKKQGKRQRNIKSILAVPIFSSCMFWPAKFSKRFNKKKFSISPWFFSAFSSSLGLGQSDYHLGDPGCAMQSENAKIQICTKIEIHKYKSPGCIKQSENGAFTLVHRQLGPWGPNFQDFHVCVQRNQFFFEETKHLISVCGDSGLQPTVLFPKCISYVYVCIEYQVICCNLNCIWNLGLCIR